MQPMAAAPPAALTATAFMIFDHIIASRSMTMAALAATRAGAVALPHSRNSTGNNDAKRQKSRHGRITGEER
jgi:hypothetical protein